RPVLFLYRMQAMLGQVGCWGNGLDVGFSPEMLEWLDSYGVERRVSLATLAVTQRDDSGSVTVDRTVRLVPDAEGVRVSPMNETMYFLHHVRFPLERFGADIRALELPRFELHEVEFEPETTGDAVCARLGDDHVLPWPRLRDCG